MQTESVATLKEETKLDDNKKSEEMGRSKEINQNQDNNKNNRKRKNRRTCNKIDMKAKLERSRQSARECRARKKLRYQYLEDLVLKRENANLLLKQEINMYREICTKIDSGQTPQELINVKVEEEKRKNNRRA